MRSNVNSDNNLRNDLGILVESSLYVLMKFSDSFSNETLDKKDSFDSKSISVKY